MKHWRMRTTLLISLLAMSLGLTLGSLFVIRFTIEQEIRSGLDADLTRSLQTYSNIQRQRDHMLSRQGALLADLPSLKALLATQDKRTINDGAAEFSSVSGADFFSLISSRGNLFTYSMRARQAAQPAVSEGLERCMRSHDAYCLLPLGGELYEISIQPLYFGPESNHSLLGYVATGYAIDSEVAREVSEAAASDVVFVADGKISATTLSDDRAHQLKVYDFGAAPVEMKLGSERYIAAASDLSSAVGGHPQILVLKSFDRASLVLNRVHSRILTLGVTSVLLAMLLATFIARTVTRPLETLALGTRAMGLGDFGYELTISGATEVRELGVAMMRTRNALKQTQRELLEAERLATIGRMASSVSHDLRHHLSAIYANAEFMSLPGTSDDERLELYLEVKDGVLAMADLVESLLIFSRTGKTLQISVESLNQILERTVHAVQQHPECRSVQIDSDTAASVHLSVDARKLERAVYNLLLNACQAALKGGPDPRVSVVLRDTDDVMEIMVSDNGLGVPDAIRTTLFQPFVSLGKENGTGLGLTLAQHIAQEHGGEVRYSRQGERTCFSIVLYKRALQTLAHNTETDDPVTAKEVLHTATGD